VDGDPDGKDWVLPATLGARVRAWPSDFTRKILPAQNQGYIGTCVGVSGKVVNEEKFKDVKLSALWIYKRAQFYDEWAGEKYSGTSISGACKMLRKEGVCREEDYPYSLLDTEPKKGATKKAASRKIKNYYTVPHEVNRLREMLLEQRLWTSFAVHEYFYRTGKDGIVDTKKYLDSDKKGGHAVVMTGWKTINGKLYLEFQNSWGSRFGDHGMFYMEPELFFKIANKTYYIVPAEGGDIKGETIIEKIIAIFDGMLEFFTGFFKR